LGWGGAVYDDYIFVEADEASPYDPVGVLGVDLGIKNLVVDSDGEVHSGEQFQNTRTKSDALKSRQRIQLRREFNTSS
jgi:putative transposase